MDLLTVVKLARGLTGLLIATWAVYALPLLAHQAAPIGVVGSWICLVAIVVGLGLAAAQVIISMVKSAA